MKILTRLLFSLQLLHLATTICWSQSQVTKGVIPDWVESINYSAEFEDNESPFNYLLVDQQQNAILEEKYSHYVIRINNPEGVQMMSSISFDYDPSYQSVIIHNIIVHRKGEIINKSISNFKYLQRETDLNRALYDGSISANNELDDIRSGDIIEYSYTIKGYNPVFGKHRFSHFYQDFSLPVQRLFQSYLINEEAQIKYYNDAKEAIISNENGTYKYEWLIENIEEVYEDYTSPSWYEFYKKVDITTMSDWGDVVEWALPLYEVENKDIARIKHKIGSEISMNGSANNIIQAIRYVQDEIRYLGFEEGINAFKPHNPATILDQKFGDCKDKSLLLTVILQEMGIDASPLLVHTSKGEILNETLPSPIQFNHCIVTFKKDHKTYFVDPTVTNQGGDLQHLSVPDFNTGLIIKKGNTDLTEIRKTDIPTIVVNEIIELDSIGGSAVYEVSTIYSGVQADYQRSYIESTSSSEIKKNLRSFYINAYPEIEITSVDIVDSMRFTENKIVYHERYNIPEAWSLKDGIYQFNFYSLALNSFLIRDPQEVKNVPYDLGSKKEFIQSSKITLPEEWNIENEVREINNQNFDYRYTVSYMNDELKFNYRYYLKNSTIQAHHVKNTLKELNTISDDLSYGITYNKGIMGQTGLAWPALLMTFLGLLLGLFISYLMYFKFDPDSLNSKLPMSIGGWLMLPAIGLITTPLIMIGDFINYNRDGLYEYSTWAILWHGSEYFVISAVFIEGIINVALLICSVTIAILFFQGRTNVPKLMMGWYTFSFVFIFIDSALGALIETSNIVNRDVVKSFFACCIWVPYFYYSTRVKNTFVYKKDGTVT